MNRVLHSLARAACVVILLAGIAACGLKGPLYLPDRPVEVIPADKAASSQSSEKKKERPATSASGSSAGSTAPATTPDR